MVERLEEQQLGTLRVGLEKFLFEGGDMSRPQEKCEEFSRAVREVIRMTTHMQAIPEESVWPVVRSAYDQAVQGARNAPTTVQGLIALTHLLVLGLYDDDDATTLKPVLRALRDVDLDDRSNLESAVVHFYDKAGSPHGPNPNESFTTVMARRVGVRHLFAALAAGMPANRVVFKSESPSRKSVMSVFWPAFREVVSAPGALREALTGEGYSPVTIESSNEPSSPPTAVNRAMVGGGWGPRRDTISSLSRPARVALNSIFNNPRYGDERNFARVRPVDEIDADYVSYLTVTPGVRYQALVYFGNSAHVESGLTTVDARVRVQAPATFEGSGRVTTFFSAANATPSTVWDSFVIGLPSPTAIAAMRYVPDSAFVHVGGLLLAVGEDLYRSEGALVGRDSLDGVLAPARSDLQFLTFEFQIDRPDFIVTCKMRKLGSETWSPEHLDVRPGDVIEVVVKYKNTGTTVQNDVVLQIPHLPDALIYTVGSTRVANSASAWKYQQTTSNLDSPLNVGNYAPGAGVYAKFEMTVRDGVMLGAGENQWLVLNPLATVETNNGTKGAQVTLILIR